MSAGGFLRGCLIVLGVCGVLFLGLVGLLLSLCGGGLHGGQNDSVFNTLMIVVLAALAIALVWALASAFKAPRGKSDDKPEN